jgi:hypothetical protein
LFSFAATSPLLQVLPRLEDAASPSFLVLLDPAALFLPALSTGGLPDHRCIQEGSRRLFEHACFPFNESLSLSPSFALPQVLPQLEAGGKKFFSFVDPGLKHTVSRPHLAGLAALAKRCLEGDPGDRPTAAEVALQLGGLGLDENVDLEASVGSVSTKDLLRREASRSPLRKTMTPMEKVPEVMSEVDLSNDDGSRALAGGRNVPCTSFSRLVGVHQTVLVVLK